MTGAAQGSLGLTRHAPGRVVRPGPAGASSGIFTRYPFLIIILLLSSFPVYWTFTIASQTNEAVGQTPPPFLPGGNFLANARRVFDTVDFAKALFNSFIVSSAITASTLLFCSLAGFAFAKLSFRGRNALVLVVLATTACRFADYADLVASALADRVRHWSTLNEPWCSAFEGNMSGRHAPGIRSPVIAVRAAHHLLLGHGLAVAALRSRGAAEVGITLNLIPAEPADGSPGAREAARLVDGQQNRLFLDALLRGRYPGDVVGDFARAGAELPIVSGDAQVIAAPIDWIGVNYYAPHIVVQGADPRGMSPFIPGDAVVHVRTTENVTALGWPVRPRSFTAMLRRLHRDYPGVPLYVHENGAAFHDVVSAHGMIDDADRCMYIARHIDAVRASVRDGVDVRGYFAWSLMDNYEWAEGYRMRFGLVHVDFATQRRTPKSSARWYAKLIEACHETRGST